LKPDEEYKFALTKQTPWVEELLRELNENAVEGTPEENLVTTELNIHVKARRKKSIELGEYLSVSVSVKSNYLTRCVRSMSPMTDEVETTFDACFIAEKWKSDPMYHDQTEIYADGKMQELYFFDSADIADLKEVCHEQIYLCVNPFPTLEHLAGEDE
jgi:hypothetical protein